MERERPRLPGVCRPLGLCLGLATVAACDYPELAMAPGAASGPPPPLLPLDPLLVETAVPDPEEDAAIEARAAALRQRAAEVPADPIEPETRAAMEAIRAR
jgi:hypothetical protein